MRAFGFAALIASMAVAAMPAEAQRLGNGAGGGPVTTHAPSMPRGGWNGMRPNTGGWKGAPNLPKPSSWSGTPRPNNGGWQKPSYPNNGGWQKPSYPNNGGWQKPPYPNNGGWNNTPRPKPGQWNGHGQRPSRWGNKVNGHWYAGHNAPGGWNGYRRPSRGYVLPSYWIAPSYFIGNYASYGLSAPPQGYNWSRYYDDAVLMDQRGQVWDSVSGLDWDRYDDGYAPDDGYDGGGAYASSDNGYAYAQGGAGASYDQGYYQRRDNGVGGAVIGGVVGGVAGNVIGGGGLTGTLVGAGVGAATGYAIDRAEDRGRYAQRSEGYSSRGDRYSGQQGGYASGGYWYPPTTTTTVTVNSAPIETVTTTTEYVEERTSYSAPRKVWRAAPKKKVWRAPRCGC